MASVQQRVGQTNMAVEQAVEGFGAAGEFDEVPFQRLCEGVEKAPDVARLECIVPWLAPFVEDFWNGAVGHDADVTRSDHEIVGGAVVDVCQFVGGEPGVLVVPAIHEFTHGGLDQTGQIAGDELRNALVLSALTVPISPTVFCVGEKSQIKALDRIQPGWPLKRGLCRTITR